MSIFSQRFSGCKTGVRGFGTPAGKIIVIELVAVGAVATAAGNPRPGRCGIVDGSNPIHPWRIRWCQVDHGGEASGSRPVARFIPLLQVEGVRPLVQRFSGRKTGVRGLGSPTGKVTFVELVAVGAVTTAAGYPRPCRCNTVGQGGAAHLGSAGRGDVDHYGKRYGPGPISRFVTFLHIEGVRPFVQIAVRGVTGGRSLSRHSGQVTVVELVKVDTGAPATGGPRPDRCGIVGGSGATQLRRLWYGNVNDYGELTGIGPVPRLVALLYVERVRLFSQRAFGSVAGSGGFHSHTGEITLIEPETVDAAACAAAGAPGPCGSGIVDRTGPTHPWRIRRRYIDDYGEASGYRPVARFVTLLNIKGALPFGQGLPGSVTGIRSFNSPAGAIAVVQLVAVGAVSTAAGGPHPCGSGIVCQGEGVHLRSLRSGDIDTDGKASGSGPVAGFITFLQEKSVLTFNQRAFRVESGGRGFDGIARKITVIELVTVGAVATVAAAFPYPCRCGVVGRSGPAYHRSVRCRDIDDNDTASGSAPVAGFVTLLNEEGVLTGRQRGIRSIAGVFRFNSAAGQVVVVELVAVGAITPAAAFPGPGRCGVVGRGNPTHPWKIRGRDVYGNHGAAGRRPVAGFVALLHVQDVRSLFQSACGGKTRVRRLGGAACKVAVIEFVAIGAVATTRSGYPHPCGCNVVGRSGTAHHRGIRRGSIDND